MKKHHVVLGICFLFPVILAIAGSIWLRSQRTESLETMIKDGVLATYNNKTIRWEDLVDYMRMPPTEDGSILRSLEMTPEDVMGLEGENPEFFSSSNGQLLILRMLKHIALLNWLEEQEFETPPALDSDVEIYRQQLLMNAMEDTFTSYTPEIKQEELLDYYVRNSSTFYREGKRLARHIMMYDTATLDEENPSASPEEILYRLRNGEDFYQLITHSESSSAEQNGQLGWLSKGSVAEPFDTTLWALEIGEVTGPIEVMDTLHFIQLLDIQDEGLLPFEDCVDEIREILQRERETEYRYKVLGITPGPDGSVSRTEYEDALLAAAYENNLHRSDKLTEQVESYRWYRQADLWFQEKVQSGGWLPLTSTNQDSIWVRESQTAAGLLDQIDFRPTVYLDTSASERSEEFPSSH